MDLCYFNHDKPYQQFKNKCTKNIVSLTLLDALIRTYSARACHTDIAINRGQMDYTGTGFCTLCLRTC